jgi:hypothetical protein
VTPLHSSMRFFMPSVETALSIGSRCPPSNGKGRVWSRDWTALCTLLAGALYQRGHVLLVLWSCDGTIHCMATCRVVCHGIRSGSFRRKFAAGPFDVTIEELKRRRRGIQAAVGTPWKGRVVIGSWYGNTAVQLNLGIDFHRPQDTDYIKVVSCQRVESNLEQGRRFAYTWDLVRQSRPSRLIKKTTLIRLRTHTLVGGQK